MRTSLLASQFRLTFNLLSKINCPTPARERRPVTLLSKNQITRSRLNSPFLTTPLSMDLQKVSIDPLPRSLISIQLVINFAKIEGNSYHGFFPYIYTKLF